MSPCAQVGISLLHHQGYVGTGGYCRHLVKELAAHPPRDLKFLAYTSDSQTCTDLPIFCQTSSKLLLRWPGKARSDRWPWAFQQSDLVHYPTCVGPELPDRPLVVTLHDVAVLLHPEWFPRRRVRYLSRRFEKLAHTARLILTDSSWQAEQIARLWPNLSQQIRVITLSVDPAFQSGSKENHELPYGLQSSYYYLCVATLEPRKNHFRLYQTWRKHNLDGDLCLVGNPGWDYSDLLKAWRNDAQEVKISGGTTIYLYADQRRLIHTQAIKTPQLCRLYQNARVLIYPSLFEGFGLPVLEALSCGCPVVTSRASAMVEIAGDAAWYCNPTETESIAEAVGQAESNPKKTQQRVQSGLARAAEYTPEKMLNSHLSAYREALNI